VAIQKTCETCKKQYSVIKCREHKTHFCSRACNRFRNQIKHGKCTSRIYKVWSAMKGRCCNETDPGFQHYGGRGIKVSDDWMTFENFYRDVGEPPFEGAQIDRINNNGDYCKDNVRWVNRKDNMRNTRRNKNVFIQGKQVCFIEACKIIGVKLHTAYARKRTNNLTHQETIDYCVRNPPAPLKVFVNYRGRLMCLTEACRKSGFNFNTVRERSKRKNIPVQESLDFYLATKKASQC
jgi:hypothetical protein